MLKHFTLILFTMLCFSAKSEIYSITISKDSTNIISPIDSIQNNTNTSVSAANKTINTQILSNNIQQDSVQKVNIPVVTALGAIRIEAFKNYLSTDTIFKKIPLSYQHVRNTGQKFLLREIEYEYSNSDTLDKPLRQAIGSLLEFSRNDTIRGMVKYIQHYLKTQKTDQALKYIQHNIQSTDTTATSDINFDNKLVDLRKQLSQDSTILWLQKAGRDSVNLSIKNMLGDSLNFWVNNGKYDYKRFWLKKSKKDSIGVWIQNNTGNSLKLFVDEDVYQASVTKQKQSGAKVKLNKIIDPDVYKLARITKRERYKQIWKFGAEVGLNLNQGHVANWTRGGESSISILATLEAFATYTKDKVKWENVLKVKYGLLKSGSESLRKNEDRIEFNTKYGQKAFKSWYYSAMINTQTQLAKGYKYPKEGNRILSSKFSGPAYFLASIGMDFKPKKDFSILLSPLTGKWTYVADSDLIDPTQYGVEKGKRLKSESGAYFKLLHTANLSKDKDIVIKNIIQLYSAYSNEPKNIDIEWEFSIFLPINQYISTSISTHLISDKDTHKKIQFKEAISLGVRYKL